MAEPSRVEFQVGKDRYGRPTKLLGELLSNGALDWTLRSEPVDQRDDGEIMRSLSTEQLRVIGEIAGGYEKRRRA